MLFDIYKMTCKASSNKYSHNGDKNLENFLVTYDHV